MSRQLVISAATGFTWTQLRPFVVSLRRTGYAGDIVLLVTRLASADRAQLESQGVRLWYVHPILSRWPVGWRRKFFSRRLGFVHRNFHRWCDRLPLPAAQRQLAKAWLGRPFHDVMCSRHFFYLAFISRHARRYDRVMLTDSRDVVFQADPFSWEARAPQQFFLEQRGVTIGNQWGNALWIKNSYGESTLSRLAEFRVSCAGVTFGSVPGILAYLSAMTGELTQLTPAVSGFSGYDQAAHNKLVWTDTFPEAAIHENHQGPVFTMHGAPTDDFPVDGQGNVVDRSGRIVPVLHQYDRHPSLAEPLLARIAP